jgi:hypothetical protein
MQRIYGRGDRQQECLRREEQVRQQILTGGARQLPAVDHRAVDRPVWNRATVAVHIFITDPAAETRCGFRADYPTIRPPKIVGPIYCDKSIHDFAHERRKLSLCGKIVSKPLERHYLLLRYKIAALLAYIEGRSKVEIIDWDRAEIIWRTSQEVLEFCLEEVEEQREAAAAEKGHSTALMQAAIKEAPPRIEEIAERIRAFLRKHPDVSNRQLRDACVNAKRGERPLFQQALKLARP